MYLNAIKSKLLCKEFMGRSNEILHSGIISDCTFLVGQEPDQELISANKSILVVTSPVFEAMFYGSLAEKKHPISLTDIHPENFNVLLNNIYTDEIMFTSIEQAGELYYSAKKFMLPHLQKRCSDYLIGKLDCSNACCVYEYGQLFEDEAFKDEATHRMSKDTKQVLNDPSFLDLKLSTLIYLFSLDKLDIENEIDLLEAAVRYNEARAKVTTQNEPGGRTEISIVEAIEKIRFLAVSPKRFADCKVKSSFLSENEILAILLNIVSPDTEVPYPKRLCESSEGRDQVRFNCKLNVNDFDSYGTCTSAKYKVKNFTWQISVTTHEADYDDYYDCDYLGIFLVCSPSSPNKNKNWSCKTKCQLKLISQTSTWKTIVLEDEFTFKDWKNMFGDKHFVLLKVLLDAKNGFIVDDHTVTVEATVSDIRPNYG